MMNAGLYTHHLPSMHAAPTVGSRVIFPYIEYIQAIVNVVLGNLLRTYYYRRAASQNSVASFPGFPVWERG